MVVISSPAWTSEIRTEHGLNALPLMCDVQALQTSMPQPYFGPVTPRMSRSTHSRRTSSGASTLTRLPLSLKVCLGTADLLAGVTQAVAARLRDGRLGRERRERQRVAVVDRELARHLAEGS